MAAFPGPRMAGVQVAVVLHFQLLGREPLAQGGFDLCGGHHGCQDCSSFFRWRLR